MKQKKMLSYIINLAQSNKYIQVNIHYLESTIFNAKVEVLFDILFHRTKPQLSH